MSRTKPSTWTLLIAAACVACSSGAPAAGMSLAGAASADSDAAAGDIGCMNEPGLDVYTPGLRKLGAAGRYEFSLVSSDPAPPALGDDTFVVQVSENGGRDLDGELSVTLDMPEHGHASPKQPNIVYDAARQAFTLSPMDLFMVGLWRFTFDFTASTANDTDGASGSAGTSGALPTDSAVFKLCVE